MNFETALSSLAVIENLIVMLMNNPSAGRTRLRKRRALHAIFSAFKWLIDNKSCDYRVQWLDDYPLLVTNSRREAFLNYQFLSRHIDKVDDESGTPGPFNYPPLARVDETVERLIDEIRYVAFTYLETPFQSHDLRNQILLHQHETIRNSFKRDYNSKRLLIVQGDTLQSNGNNSINE